LREPGSSIEKGRNLLLGDLVLRQSSTLRGIGGRKITA